MLLLPLLAACLNPNPDPPASLVGERLFMEPRFAELFASSAGSNLNEPLAEGDPALEMLSRPEGDFASPFAGSTMSCRSCHLVDDVTVSVASSVRTYADFARRTPIPDRGDGLTVTLRNTPALVEASEARDGAFFLHFDGEFTTGSDLVKGGFTGRNLGWLPEERDASVAHLARVIREDDGTFPSAAPGARVPYRALFAGSDRAIPRGMELPADQQFDVENASDEEILDAVAMYVNVYLETIRYSRGLESDEHNGSPYDVFLQKNGLDRAPSAGESPQAYTARLSEAVGALSDPAWVNDLDGTFGLHPQTFTFGQDELDGLQVFLDQCAACHTPPMFTDFALHNTGVSQEEYDGIWGEGAFAVLDLPDLDRRAADPGPYLPASAEHPDWEGAGRAIPSAEDPARVDLGAWAVFANDDHPGSQEGLRQLIDDAYGLDGQASDAERLEHAIALFKTPSLRDLGQSAPYLHDGSADDLDAVLAHYQRASDAQRAGTLRNGDDRLAELSLTSAEVAVLKAFLLSLNEDYE